MAELLSHSVFMLSTELISRMPWNAIPAELSAVVARPAARNVP